jgi:hypothetical protein
MFSGKSTNGDDARHLLGRDNGAEDEDQQVVWDQHSERNTASDTELWEQDPLSDESHELQQASDAELTPTSSRPPTTRARKAKSIPEDHGVAGTDLQAEFERIFSPVRLQVISS